MSSFTDYYTVLGVEADAPPDAIKAAFKKLALQYHPDVYKGDDAHERMRVLLLAYQTLNNPTARKEYDSQRSERREASVITNLSASGKRPFASSSSEVSPHARRDRQRYYAFPDLHTERSVAVELGASAYTLTAEQAHTLVKLGMLRGNAPTGADHSYLCHRCRHQWRPITASPPRTCPQCHADDWTEYLLLRCVHCTAIFESEQIRYEIGTYSYGPQGNNRGELCPPYELFPLCPYCATAHWCPAEEVRVDELRQQAERHAAFLRIIWLFAGILCILLLVAVFALGILH